jgi:hypothetical protein
LKHSQNTCISGVTVKFHHDTPFRTKFPAVYLPLPAQFNLSFTQS